MWLICPTTSRTNQIIWPTLSLFFPIGHIFRYLIIFFQHCFLLWLLPAKWSVTQPLGAPVVGSTQPLCQKLIIFWPFPAISSIIYSSSINPQFLILLLGFLSVSGNSSLNLSPTVLDTPDISFMVLGISLILLSSVVHCLTLIPSILPRLWMFLFWSLCQLTTLSARIFIYGIALLRCIGGSFLSTTHYQHSKKYLLLLIYIISLWSFSWYFGSLRNRYFPQTILVFNSNTSMPLVPDK